MDTKSIGNTISKLRKKHSMTQLQLAQRLNISDKTVSKWESGQGYPDVTAFPLLAALFGVSIDYLMLGERKGIAIAGNLIADIVKNIDIYPETGMMAYVSDISYAVGGCVPNTAINLAKIDYSIPISAFGKVGTDENGRYIVSQLVKNGIHVDGIGFSDKTPTSFCDVMSMPSGERTFFHARGANALFCPGDVDIPSLNCRILHIGYILLLDQFDAPDPEYGTVMARFLHNVQKVGIRTSIDVVSNDEGDFPNMIIPALKYCDYVIINEVECCATWGLEPRNPDGSLNPATVRRAMEKTMACGVKEKVIVHSKEAGFCLDCSGTFTAVPSLRLPPEELKGSVGAGDAFCAGCLHGIYHKHTDKDILEFASATAACNLFAENAVDGMRSRQEILQVMRKYPRQSLPTE